jgi:hypothetical protein
MRESLDRGDREKFNRDMGLAVKIPALARTLAFRLVPGRADVLHFGADEGAAYHCQPTGRLLTENRMFDWLTDLVPAPHR